MILVVHQLQVHLQDLDNLDALWGLWDPARLMEAKWSRLEQQSLKPFLHSVSDGTSLAGLFHLVLQGFRGNHVLLCILSALGVLDCRYLHDLQEALEGLEREITSQTHDSLQ